MSGKEHMIVGTTATATMGVGFLITKTFDSVIYLIPLIIGGFIGSYMPDIDSHNSKVRQVFNKILTFLIIGKLSPHRMFTHKWLGTFLFCGCVYFIGNIYLTLGFTMGYILHIVCDRFSPRGKNLKFFEFKLPCRNSKNKTTIVW